MRPAWLEVDLDAYRGNLRALQALCGGAGALAVVKANAYGHGLVPLARAALQAGCPAVGVALPEEGAALREACVDGRIVVLGVTLPEQAGELVASDLEAVVSARWGIDALAGAAANQPQPAPVHLKVDTGMTRVGAPPDEALALCQQIVATPALRLAGVLTHFASADADPAQTTEQWERFQAVIQRVRGVAGDGVAFHAANSAAVLNHPETHLDLVRPGLVTYGVPPSPGPLPAGLRPVLSLRARVTQVRWVPPGAAVGYGATFVTPRRSLLAIVPVGYADGLPWRAAGRLRALLRGTPVPVAGRISMDQVVLDATDLGEVAPGEVATFIGRDGEREIRVTELAEAAGTIPYEVLTGLSARLPRVYREGGGYNGGSPP